MSNKFNRAVRRHHVERLKQSRKYFWGRQRLTDPRRLGILVHTPKLCSCYGCGNQRKYKGLSISELRDLEQMMSDLEDVYESEKEGE